MSTRERGSRGRRDPGESEETASPEGFLSRCGIDPGIGAGERASDHPADARAIAKEATVYGFPMVDSYRIQYDYFVDRGGSDGKWKHSPLVPESGNRSSEAALEESV